jgi:NADPH:quinone reductase-like Zn-dependent oxidoreductase
VVATSSSDEKLETARKLGATHLINYRNNANWADEVLKLTNGTGVDLVVDVVGAESIEQTVKATTMGGHIAITGMLSKDPWEPASIVNDILFKALTGEHLIGLHGDRSKANDTDIVQGTLIAASREVLAAFSAFTEKHDLHPPIAKVFEFEEADKGLDELTSLSVPGKIVVRC